MAMTNVDQQAVAQEVSYVLFKLYCFQFNIARICFLQQVTDINLFICELHRLCTLQVLQLKVFTASTSTAAASQTVAVTVDSGYKIISGGGKMTSGDILMLETYPTDNNTMWVTSHSMHVVSTTGNAAAYAIGLYDPDDEWDVSVFTEESTSSATPSVSVSVPDGYLMTGGGAEVTSSDSGAGLVIIGSYPSGNSTWTAVANEHRSVGTGKVRAYAIGLKHKTYYCLHECAIASAVSSSAQHPTVTITRTDPIIIGGGAYGTLPADNPLAGNILIDTYPGVTDGTNWVAKAKDHMIVQHGTVTAYSIECPNINITFV